MVANSVPACEGKRMYQYEYPHPAVTTDAVLFSIRESRLHVLLIQRGNAPYQGRWAFPGGFVDIDEDLDAAVYRELAEETGIADVALEQFHAFGTPGRDPRERVITIAFLGVMADGGTEPVAADDAAAAAWFDITELPALAFDHDQMLEVARSSLRQRIETSDLAMGFLGERFTVSDVQGVYETIMGDQLDPDVFRDWLLAQGWLEQTGDYSEPG